MKENNTEIFVWRPWFPPGTFSYLLRTFLNKNDLTKSIIDIERKLGNYMGSKYIILMPSGTASIYAVLKSILPKSNGDILLPSLICETIPYAIQAAGKKPHFIDIYPNTYEINKEALKCEISDSTEAILAVHQLGFPCEIEEISQIAIENNLLLIEDAAQILGGNIQGKKCGTIGDIGILSFNNKVLDACGGGAVITDNKEYFDKIKKFRDENFKKTKKGFAVSILRCWLLFYCPKLAIRLAKLTTENNRITINEELKIITPMLIDYQLSFLDSILDRRKKNYYIYDNCFNEKRIKKPELLNGPSGAFYTIQFEKNIRDEVKEKLLKMGIHTVILAECMHQKYSFRPNLPFSFDTIQKMLSFPTDPNLKNNDIEYISEEVKKILGQIKK